MWGNNRTKILSGIVLFTMFVIVGMFAIPVVTAQSGIDVTDGSEIELEGLDVQVEPSHSDTGSNGQIQYDVTVNGKIASDGVPLLYPVRVNFYDVTDYSGSLSKSSLEDSSNVDTLQKQTVILNPTQPKSFVPNQEPTSGEERTMVRNFKTNIAFPDMLDTDYENKEVVVIAESTRSPNEDVVTRNDAIDGSLPSGVSSSVIQQSEDINILSDISFVDNYRISPDGQNAQYSEDMGLPSPNDDELNGDLQQFSNMRSPFGESTVISGDDKVSFITRTENIPTGQPYTVLITYDISEGDEFTVDPINPVGREILEDTEYTLPDDASDQDNCREVDVGDGSTNLCVLYLDQGEVDLIGSINEAMLHYKADESATISIMCQSVVSGYLPRDGEACGINPAQGESEDPVSAVTLDIQGQAGSIDDNSWDAGPISVIADMDDNVDNNIRYDVRETIDGATDDGDYTVRVYSDDQLNSQGEISSSATPLHEESISNYDGGSWIEFTDSSYPVENLSQKYHVVLCQSGASVPDGCGISTNSDHESISFTPPTIPDADLQVRSPMIINPLAIDNPIDEDAISVRTETLETPDSDYHVGTEWEQTNNGDPVIEGFEGTIRQEVTVENVFEDKKNEAQSGEILQEALEKRADAGLPSDAWEYDVSITRVESKEMHIPSSENLEDYTDLQAGWYDQPGTGERSVQVGKTQDTFPIVDKGTFASRVEGQERWYPLRSSEADRPTTEFVFDTRLRKTDPDNCLNCLMTEDREDAEARLSQSQGGVTSVAGTAGYNAWEQVNNEPIIVTGEELDFNFFRRSDVSARTLTYQNIGLANNNSYKYRHRQSTKESIELNQWEYSPEILESPFERPVTELTDRYTRHKYDITYTFEAELDSPTDIYRYEKDVTEDIVNYENGHIAWVDVSQSEPEDELEQFNVQFEGADQAISVDWIEDIHSVPPEERDSAIANTCDETSSELGNFDTGSEFPVSLGLSQDNLDKLQRLDGLYKGIGGTPVVQKCNIDGEEHIVRVGQEYTQPGIFSYDVDLSKSSEEETGVVEVIPEREGDLPEDPSLGSEPELTNVEAINERVDFQMGVVALEGNIVSQTHQLDDDYEVTVTPADNIDASSVSCSELGGGYRSVMNKTVTDTYPSGSSFRQVEKCIIDGFDSPDVVPSEYEKKQINVNYTTQSIGSATIRTVSTFEVQASDVPAGAIQRCKAPLEENSDGDCIAPESMSGLSSDNPIDFQNADGSYSSVEKVDPSTPPLGSECAYGYESEIESLDNEYDKSYVTKCSLENEEAISIDLRSRNVNYQFEGVQSGIIESCSEIPTVGEDQEHDGYEDVGGSDVEQCALLGNGQGPTQFVLSETTIDETTGEETTEYQDLPAGAVRGMAFTTGETADRCQDVTIEDDGAMICEYNDGEEVTSIRFGTKTVGAWTSSSDTVSDLVDQTNARKSVWNGDKVVPSQPDEYNETFTTTINPRSTGISLEQGSVNFTFELRDKQTAEVIQEEDMEVQLCSAGSIDSREDLPRGTMGQYECENFDTLMSGSDDFQGGMTVEEAISDYGSNSDLSSVGEQEYVIDAVTNDACPYTQEFPRDQESLVNNTDAYTVTIDADSRSELRDEEERIQSELESTLVSQYSPMGDDPCERVHDPQAEMPIFVEDPADVSIQFDKALFVNAESRDFVRVAGLEDLHQIVPNPVQSRWTKDDMGSAIRLGTPIVLKDSPTINSSDYNTVPEAFDVNQNLVSHYTFDHDPEQQIQFTRHTTELKYGDVSEENATVATSIPNHYVIQDVGMEETIEAPDGSEMGYNIEQFNTDEDYYSEGIYNARLWYGSPCHAESRYDSGRVIHPAAIQPIGDNIGPSQNPQAFSAEPCENVLNSNEATEIANYGYVNNYQYTTLSTYPGWLYDGGITTSLSTLTDEVPSDQSAFLPVPPTENWQDQYATFGGNILNSYEAVDDNYAEKKGVFGGNALKLDKTSWLMLTPPCHDQSSIGDDLPSVDTALRLGSQGSCDPGEDLGDDDWAGGWQDSYTNSEEQLEGSSIHNEIDDEYTVSFWVNTKNEENNMDPVSADNGNSVAPLRSVYATSTTMEYNDWGSEPNPNILPSTSELNLVKAPEYISLEGIPEEEIEESPVLSGTRMNPPTGPNAWDYPAHYNLKDTARACISYEHNVGGVLPSSMTYDFTTSFALSEQQRPVMCEIFEASNSEHAQEYDDLTRYDQDILSSGMYEPPFLDDFRKEMIDRMVFENRLDWPVGSAIDTNSTLNNDYPAYDADQTFASESSYEGCSFATQRESYTTDDAKCYYNGRYIFSNDGAREVRTEDTYDGSDWQHVTIRYNADDAGSNLQIYVNGERKASSSSDEIALNERSGRETVQVGELYDDSIMSIGGVYQDPGYNFDPNNITEGYEADFVPYIHASQGELLVDEMRIYDTALEPEEVQRRDVPNATPVVEHDLPVDAPMYTGTLETDSTTTDAKGDDISKLLSEDNYRTFEVDVDAGSDGPAAYKIEIIPCINDETCLSNSSVTVSEAQVPEEMGGSTTESGITTSGDYETTGTESGDTGSSDSQGDIMQLSGITEVVRFSGEQLTDEQLSEIDQFKLNVEIGSPYIDSSPFVRNIEMEPAGDPFSSCQGIIENHPGAEGMYGSEFNMTIIDSTGITTETNCDMKRAGGGWTQFAWVDTAEDDTFAKDTQPSDNFFINDTRLSDCQLSDDACFATANWDDEVMDNIDSGDGPYPQIMIRAVDENDVVDWASFQINEQAHRTIEPEFGVDTIGHANQLAGIFSGDAGSVSGNGPLDYAGQGTSEFTLTSDDQGPDGLYSQCLHPFDNSGDFGRRCISHISSETPNDAGGSNTRISLIESSVSIGSSASSYSTGPRYLEEIIDIQRNDNTNQIEHMSCLGQEVDRCEFYYRNGDDFMPLTQQNGVSQISGVFDLDDYVLDKESEDIGGTWARGYVFEPLADTQIESLYSGTAQNNENGDWWIGLYEMDGNSVGDLIVAEDAANGDFVENELETADPVVIEPGNNYAIIQGTSNVNNGNMTGYNPSAMVDITEATNDHPIKTFRPTEQGYSFTFSEGSATPNTVKGETVDFTVDNPESELRVPRVGFEYEVITDGVPTIDTIPTIGYLSKFDSDSEILYGDEIGHVLDADTRGIDYYEQHDISTQLRPDRTGDGLYFGNVDGQIVNVKYDDYNPSNSSTKYDRDDSQAEIVVETGFGGIEQLEIDPNGQVAYVRNTNTIAAFDLRSGEELWRYAFSANGDGFYPMEMAMGEDHVYAANPAGTIVEISKDDGSENASLNVLLEGANTQNAKIHGFGASEEANKIVYVDGGQAPKVLTLEELRTKDDNYEPRRLATIDGTASIIQTDGGEVAVADDGRVAVWMRDGRTIDGGDVTHGYGTYDAENDQMAERKRYYISAENPDSQLVTELDIGPNGDMFVAGTNGEESVARVHFFRTNTGDNIYSLRAYEKVFSLDFFGRIK